MDQYIRHIVGQIVEDPVVHFIHQVTFHVLLTYPFFVALLIVFDHIIGILQRKYSRENAKNEEKLKLRREESQGRFDSLNKVFSSSKLGSGEQVSSSRDGDALAPTLLDERFWTWHPTLQSLIELRCRRRPSFWARRVAYSVTFTGAAMLFGLSRAVGYYIVYPLFGLVGINLKQPNKDNTGESAAFLKLRKMAGYFTSTNFIKQWLKFSKSFLRSNEVPPSSQLTNEKSQIKSLDELYPSSFPGEEHGMVHGIFHSTPSKSQTRRPKPRHFRILLVVIISVSITIYNAEDYLMTLSSFRPTLSQTAQQDSSANPLLPPFEVFPVHLSFREIACNVTAVDRPILSGISGEIHAGRLTAILGPSGSGKTVLAGILMGRSHSICSAMTGEVFLNGRHRSLNVILNHVGFVPQEEEFFPLATVEEVLHFNAHWRLPVFTSQEERSALVDYVINIMDLQAIRHELLGDVLKRSISGGERKRVSIAMELIARPSVLILDEPTSGLDSASTFKLMTVLKRLTKHGVAVVAILHLPSARVYDMVDDLLLLKRGECVYSGPRRYLPWFWNGLGFQFPQRNLYRNTAAPRRSPSGPVVSIPEFILDVLAEMEPYPSHVAKQLRRPVTAGRTLAQLWRKRQDRLVRMCDSAGPVQSSVLPERLEVCPKSSPLQMGMAERQDRLWCEAHQSQRTENVQTESYLLDMCHAIQDRNARHSCFLFAQLIHPQGATEQFPAPTNPGVFQQAEIWLYFLIRSNLRTPPITLLAQYLGIAGLAMASSWVRSYSDDWSARASSNIILSIAMSCTGVFTAVFYDDLRPAQRSIDAGMMLISHHFALLLIRVVHGAIVSTWFTTVYHCFYRMRRGEWCAGNPRKAILRYVEFGYLMQLHFQCALALGMLITLLTEPDAGRACILSILGVMLGHVFSLFSPNQRQIDLDSLILNKYSIRKAVKFLTFVSPVRYFLEALLLWEPKNKDDSGRKFTLRYFGYVEGNRSVCCNALFAEWQFLLLLRAFLYSLIHRSEYHALHYLPLFGILVTRVFGFSFLFFAVVMVLHEWPAAVVAWHDASNDFGNAVHRMKYVKRNPGILSRQGLAPLNNITENDEFDEMQYHQVDDVSESNSPSESGSNELGSVTTLENEVEFQTQEETSDEVDKAKVLREELLREIDLLRQQLADKQVQWQGFGLGG